jgi:hypothetical protein
MNNKKIRTKKKSGNFVTIDTKIISDKNLSSNAKILLISILSDSDSFEVSQSLYCKRLGWEKNQFTRAIEQLEKTGYVKRTKLDSDKAIAGKLKKGSNRILYFYTVSEYGNLNILENDGDNSISSNDIEPPTKEEIEWLAQEVNDNEFIKQSINYINGDLWEKWQVDRTKYRELVKELNHKASEIQAKYVQHLKTILPDFNSSKYSKSVIQKMEDKIKHVVYNERRFFKSESVGGEDYEAKSFWLHLRNDYNQKRNKNRIDPETSALND